MRAERVTALVIDIVDNYNEDMENFLIQRGWKLSTFEDLGYRQPHIIKVLKHPDAKAVHFNSTSNVRIFFPDEGEAQMFCLAFGHKIHSSYIPSIQKFKDGTY